MRQAAIANRVTKPGKCPGNFLDVPQHYEKIIIILFFKC
jgi:hypothetical protein